MPNRKILALVMTRIVTLSDTHGLHDDVDVPDDGEILIHGGDITGRGRLDEVADFDDWLSIRPHAHRVVIAGNHDRCLEERPEEAEAKLEHATYLRDSGCEIAGLKIWGSPWTPMFFDWSFMLERGEKIAEKWAQIPDDTDVLVTHGPPHGILDEAHGATHAGCEALRERVLEIEPRLHIFGHIHEARGRLERGATTFINASCFRGLDPFVVDL